MSKEKQQFTFWICNGSWMEKFVADWHKRIEHNFCA